MNLLKIKLIILSFLFILGCNNTSQKPAMEDSSISAKQNSKQEETPIIDLTKYGIANNPNNILGGLKVGDKAPDFKMSNQDGEEINLKNTLQKGPVLLVFLRAEWLSLIHI